jgi:hypothetical protein
MMITMWRIFVMFGGIDWWRAEEWTPRWPLLAELSPAAIATNAAIAIKATTRAHLI